MRHQMAVSIVLFSLLFFNISFAQNNSSVVINSPRISLQTHSFPPTFSTTYWQLDTLFDEVIDAEKMHRETYLLFSPLENTEGNFNGKFTGATGCNDILGKYKARNFKLSFDVEHIAMTRLACLEGSIESEFLEALKKTKAWKIDEGLLKLLDVNKTSIAVFKAIEK